MPPKPYLREVLLKSSQSRPSSYPFDIPAVRHLSRLTLDPHITFLAGENGTGKSTLLEAIAVAFGLNAEGGSRNFQFSTRASHSELHTHLRLVRSYQRPRDCFFLRAESFFNVATEIERLDSEGGLGSPIIDSYGGRSLHQQSHGESFLALVMQRFHGHGLYILDEPESALSPMRQLALLRRIRQLIQLESQFIIATHSPILLAYPGAQILLLDEQGYRPIPYRETDHYCVAKALLNDPDGYLQRLFIEDDLA